jgi:hypothetical protein
MMFVGMGRSGEDAAGMFGADIRASASIYEADVSFASVLKGTGSAPSHLKTIGEGSSSLSRGELVVRRLGARSRSSTGVSPPGSCRRRSLTGGGAEKEESRDDAQRLPTPSSSSALRTISPRR